MTTRHICCHPPPPANDADLKLVAPRRTGPFTETEQQATEGAQRWLLKQTSRLLNIPLGNMKK
jgi:hypothetical protein